MTLAQAQLRDRVHRLVRDKPRMRRSERNGDADNRNESDDRDAGNATFPSSHTNYANCMVTMQSGSGGDHVQYMDGEHDRTDDHCETALTASTAYTVKYWCGGNRAWVKRKARA